MSSLSTEEKSMEQKIAELPPMPPAPEYDGSGEGHYKGKFYDDWSAAIADHEGDIAEARRARLALAVAFMESKSPGPGCACCAELRALIAACKEGL